MAMFVSLCVHISLQNGNSPIHDAAKSNQIEVVKLLVEKYHVDPAASNLLVCTWRECILYLPVWLCMYTGRSATNPYLCGMWTLGNIQTVL